WTETVARATVSVQTLGGTLLGGEALRRTATRGPHRRHAIHSVSSTTAGGGPAETMPEIGSSLSAAGSMSRATTHPRTRRPGSGTGTIVPTRTSAPRSIV